MLTSLIVICELWLSAAELFLHGRLIMINLFCRFSSDLLTVDEELSQTISQVTNSVFSCIGALAAIAAATKGTFLALVPPLIYIYNYVQTYFRKTNTTVARMESISRSPIYADFSQTLTGLVSIRAYHEQDRFIKHLGGSI